MSVFHTLFEDFPFYLVLLCWIRICIVFAWIRIGIQIRIKFHPGSGSESKVHPGSGSLTNFCTSWIRIRIKMIRIRHTVAQGRNFIMARIFSTKCGALALKLSSAVALIRWRENFNFNNSAVVHWRKDLKSGTCRSGRN